jgi:hypothetical protein
MEGVPVTEPQQVGWSANRNAPTTISVQLGDWANGIYFARLTAPDGQNYYAPLIVRPHPFGTHRVAVVLETNTWQAYNHYDANGDGWGDTWYAANDIRTVDLTRPYTQGGAPPKWRYWAVPFLHWLYRTGKQVDFLSDDDLERFRSAKTLAHLYDLIVFPGHEEYVTPHAYDLIAGYRNLGGNLIFLSSTNLLWKINHHGNLITRDASGAHSEGLKHRWSASNTGPTTKASIAPPTSSPPTDGSPGSSPALTRKRSPSGRSSESNTT